MPSVSRVPEVLSTAGLGQDISITKIILVLAALAVVAACVGFAVFGRGKSLPADEAAGVYLPPREVPTSATPVNPYEERAKPRPPKAEETAPGGGQSWGP